MINSLKNYKKLRLLLFYAKRSIPVIPLCSASAYMIDNFHRRYTGRSREIKILIMFAFCTCITTRQTIELLSDAV